MNAPNADEIMARIEKKCIPEPNSGCWLWFGTQSVKKYGTIRVGKKYFFVHRLIWTINNRPLEIGECVLHKCDMPSCVNPNHLFVGTQADNVKDMVTKRRHSHGERHRKLFLGEKSPNSKLTEGQVISIRADQRTDAKIAITYGISRSNVSAIKARTSWNHI